MEMIIKGYAIYVIICIAAAIIMYLAGRYTDLLDRWKNEQPIEVGDLFTPELGQIFGQPAQDFTAPAYLLTALRMIAAKAELIHDFKSFFNYGCSEFETCEFIAEGYSWDDGYEQPFNFKWRDLEISWYKHCQRGVSINRPISSMECLDMLAKCLGSL